MHVDRQIDADSPNFRTVRVFVPESSGTYTLYNDAEEGDLWLVDDIKSQTKLLEDSPVSILVMVAGCCIGGPLRNRWTGSCSNWVEKKKPTVQVNIQTPMMTTDDIYKSLHREQFLENEEELVPGPFTDVEEEPDLEDYPELEDQEEKGAGKTGTTDDFLNVISPHSYSRNLKVQELQLGRDPMMIKGKKADLRLSLKSLAS